MALCDDSEDPNLTWIPEAAEALSVDHWWPLSHCSWHQYLFVIIKFSEKNSFQEKQSGHSEDTKGNKTSKIQSTAN